MRFPAPRLFSDGSGDAIGYSDSVVFPIRIVPREPGKPVTLRLKLDYAVCLPDKCTAEVPLTDAMIASLKKGTDVTFTSINFRRAPNPIKISLQGFGAAFDGEAISESKLAESQKSLQDSMQKKAEEARKKLEDAQKAAKQQ